MIDPGQLAAMPAQAPVDPTAQAMLAADPGAQAPASKQPPLLLPPRLATQIARGYVDQAQSMAKLVADQAGPPDDFERYPVKEQVAAYFKRDARHDPLALQEQGLSATEIRDKVYPLRRILLKMAGPRPADRVKFAERMMAERQKLAMVEGEHPV